MRGSILLGLSLLNSVWASDYIVNPATVKKRICQIENPTLVKDVEVSLRPNYFFRYLSKRKLIAFSSAEKKNYLFNMETKDTHRAPGKYDAVPLWGEDVLTVPRPMRVLGAGGTGLFFYAIDDILAGDSDPEPLYLDEDLKGVYQSVAEITKPTPSGYINRVITDYNGVSVRDYKVEKKNGKVVSIKPLGEAKNICKNYKIKTPMISKDGLELAGFDTIAGVSKIWRINPELDECEEIFNLEIPTGKIDFSFDKRFLTFHLNSSNKRYSGTSRGLGDRYSNYDETPDESDNTNIFVYDRKNKNYKQITFNANSNSYFPVWSRENTVVFINFDARSSLSFMIADPVLATTSNMTDLHTICGGKTLPFCQSGQSPEELEDFVLNFSIGAMWLNVCSKTKNINPKMASLLARSMDKKTCNFLIDDLWWGKTPNKIKKLVRDSQEDYDKSLKIKWSKRRKNKKVLKRKLKQFVHLDSMRALCDNKTSDGKVETDPVIDGPVISEEEKKAINAFQKNCIFCHGGVDLANKEQFRELKAVATYGRNGEEIVWAKAASMRIQGAGNYPVMPPTGSLSRNDKKALLDYLKTFFE